VNRVIVPFLACGDLSAYDSDKTYDVNDGTQYVPLPPVQGPINPPYQTACYLKKNSLLATQKTVSNTSEEKDCHDESENTTEPTVAYDNDLQMKNKSDIKANEHEDDSEALKSDIATAID
jgi:hypothetical protein